MRRPLITAILIGLVAVVALLVLGLPQLSAVAPVGGLPTSRVRAAGIDLLVARRVPFEHAPVCAERDSQVMCIGERTDGAPIRIDGPADGSGPVVVTVAGQVLAAAPAQPVVDGAGSGG